MNKVAVITGGSLGIGAAAVKKFSEEGYRVYNLDIVEPENEYINSRFIHCDVSSISKTQEAVDKILKETGRVDVAVANAGKHYSANIENTTEEKFDEIISLNIKGTFFLLKSILPIMRAQMQGVIVIVSSEQCFVGKPNSAVYGMTKAAIAQLCKSTAIDYANFNIRVNAVCPGTIDTPLYRKAIQNYSERTGISLEEIEKNEAKEQLLNRVGEPEEVSNLIYFLSGEQSKFITGALFPIDGGYTAR